MAAAASGEGSTASLLQPDAPSINIPLPPLPLRCPPYPESDNWKALRDWNMGCWRISKLAAKADDRLITNNYAYLLVGTRTLSWDALASLSVSSESDLPLQLPSFGSNPNYGLKSGIGGVVIDHDGNVVGMTFVNSKPSILAISTIITCIEMWLKFSRIARPAHGLRLRTVDLLEVSLQEVISRDSNIHSGYIVDQVEADSTAERLGVRYGDVIVSFDGLRSHTLPRLEDYLLSLGWKFLEKNIDSSSTTDLTLEVYDLLGRIKRNITLPVEFSDP
ncbi:unnamed protein product [Miscanthus lutarioriparius]|uniref:PDZ domain-containing protein n=1 Tax=Miscanthus lutarioriparius TaxID=422564 RepID=A0A811QJ11_9POAL|nr:unnamed protein product [Miscanthus lutarioriparius]